MRPARPLVHGSGQHDHLRERLRMLAALSPQWVAGPHMPPPAPVSRGLTAHSCGPAAPELASRPTPIGKNCDCVGRSAQERYPPEVNSEARRHCACIGPPQAPLLHPGPPAHHHRRQRAVRAAVAGAMEKENLPAASGHDQLLHCTPPPRATIKAGAHLGSFTHAVCLRCGADSCRPTASKPSSL